MADQLRLGIDEDRDGAAVAAPFWERAVARVCDQVGKPLVRSWLVDSRPLSFDEGLLVIGTENGTAREWIRSKYVPLLAKIFGEEQGAAVRIEVVVAPREKPARSIPKSRPAPQAARASFDPAFQPLPLHEHYTFENYVVGQSSRLAHAAAVRVADEPGSAFNPLFVYGRSGVGKTHLLHAIGHRLLAHNPQARVAYINGETFTSHFITSLRESKQKPFREHYRNVDIWLVDDIQFIADKTSTKEEFFHTFNELYLTNRQIVCAADRPPKELRLMDDRLRSRLQSGMLAEILPPELETRMAILEQRAALEQIELPPDVVLCLASAIKDNVRTLEAALIRLLALASLNESEITAELAVRALEAFVSDGAISEVTIAAIQEMVCEQFSVSSEALKGPRRNREISLARQVAMYLCRKYSRGTLAAIGEEFGGKTHSTVIYACNKLEAEMKQDDQLSQAVTRLCTRLAAAHRGRD